MKYIHFLTALFLFVITSCHHISPKQEAIRKLASTKDLMPLPKNKFFPEVRELQYQQFQGQVCVKQICGDTTKNISYEDTVVEQKTKKTYIPGSNEYKAVNKALYDYTYQELTSDGLKFDVYKYLVDHPDYKISPIWKAFFNRAYFTQIYLMAAVIKQQEDISETLNIPLLLPADFDGLPISAAEKAWVKKVLAKSTLATEVINSFVKYYSYKYAESARIFSSDEYPEVPFSQAIRLMVDKCRKDINDMAAIMGTPALSESLPICSGKTTYFDERSLGQELGVIEMFTVFVPKTNDPLFLEREWDWHSDVRRYIGTAEYRIRRRLPYVPVQNIEKQINETVKYCQDVISPAIELSPNNRKLAIVNRSIKSIREATKKLISIKDPRLRAQFEKGLDRTGFQLPPVRSTLVNNIIKRFSLAKEAARKSNAALNDPQRPEFAFNLMDLLQVNWSDKGPEETLKTFTEWSQATIKEECSIYAVDSFSDGMYTQNGEAFISWTSVKHLSIGYGVIAHEMGHRVSELLMQMGRNGKGAYYLGMTEQIPIWEKRACTNTLHGKTTTQSSNGENYKTEEDWADYFAAKIILENRAKMPWPKNFGCALTTENTNKPGYDVNFKEYDEDPHSSGAFRTIHFEKALNGLSHSCNQSLKQLNNLPSCFYDK